MMKAKMSVARRRSLLLAITILVCLPAIGLAADDVARSCTIHSALPQLLEDGARPVWLFFHDKCGAEEDAAAFARARAGLSERALARRAKVLHVDEPVLWIDLPLCEDYLSWLDERGFEIRAASRWLNAVSVVAGAADLDILREAPFIARIQPVAASAGWKEESAIPSTGRETDTFRSTKPGDSETPISDGAGDRDDPIDYGDSETELIQINVPAVHLTGNHGEGVYIGMLDSGYNVNHETFQSMDVLGAWDFINDDPIVENEDGDDESQENHGTMTLSTVGGYMPGSQVGPAFGASFYLAKTEDTSMEEPIEEDYWVEGIEWLESEGCDVVSSSLCYSDWYTYDDLDGNTCVTTIAGDAAVALGVVVVNSVGNSRQSCGHLLAPSDGDSVIAAGGVNADGQYCSFSSPGPSADGRIKPDVAARGTECNVAAPGTWDEYFFAGGTSFSCPLTSGVAALVLSANPGITPMQLRAALRQTADRADNPDNDYGWGILNALDAVAYGSLTAAPASNAAPGALSLHGNYPNPFNPATTLSFSQAEAGYLRLSIHDVSGRLVRTVHAGDTAAGRHDFVWRGLDDSGLPVASGLYFARLCSGAEILQNKMLLLK